MENTRTFEFVVDKELQRKIDDVVHAGIQDEMYGELVDKFVRQHYSQSRVEAIMNNYIDEPTEKHIAEFQLLQTCRRDAKSYAKELLFIN